jgi:hypothetical protein
LSLFVSNDNLRKGAALNAVAIAERGSPRSQAPRLTLRRDIGWGLTDLGPGPRITPRVS